MLLEEIAPETGPGSALLYELFDRARLSPAQRRIAQYILAHPEEALFLSGTDLARRVGVSQPSVTRLATTLGFRGYTELHQRIREVVGTRAERVADATPNKFRHAVMQEIRNLEVLAGSLADASAVEEAGRILAAASTLIVLGLRASRGVASYFAYFASKVHGDVRLLTEGGSLVFDRLMQARTPSACVLCFVLPRYPKETVEALAYARKLGMRTVVVTDRLGPLVEQADIGFAVQLEVHTVFDSHAAPLVLANLLVEALCDADNEHTERLLEEQERMMEEVRTFWKG